MTAYNHSPTVALIKALEGITLVAKYDVNRYRIGYGCELDEYGNYIKAGMKIDVARANAILAYNLKVKETALNKLLTNESALNQYQRGALLSFCFNRGIGSFQNSTLRKLINANPNDKTIAQQFKNEWGSNYDYYKALVERREKEAVFYFTKAVGSVVPTAENNKFTNALIALAIGVAVAKRKTILKLFK